MKLTVSPWFLRAVGVVLFGALVATRAEVSDAWWRALLAGGAFATLAALWSVPRRPLNFSLHAHRRAPRPKE